jgi:hypothetical protein
MVFPILFINLAQGQIRAVDSLNMAMNETRNDTLETLFQVLQFLKTT